MLVIIDHQNGFKLEAVDVRLDSFWFRLKVHQLLRSALAVPRHWIRGQKSGVNGPKF